MIFATKTQKLILPALILITPFLVFLNYNSYCLVCIETWLAIGGLILLAAVCSVAMMLGGSMLSGLVMAVLVTAFIDIQFTPRNLADWVNGWMAILLFAGMQTFVLTSFLKEKFYTIATAVFLTFFAVTVIQLVLPSNNRASFFAHRQNADAHAPPRIIHLILDEHIGIEGIPTDVEGGPAIKNLITQFYLKNGFQLFGGAYSHYFKTHLSISNMLNFTAQTNLTRLITGRGPYKLLRNQYFKLLSERNYQIEVLAPEWVDYCADSSVVVRRCIEKNWDDLKNLPKLVLPVSQKLQVLYSRYLGQSAIVLAIVFQVVLPLQSKFPALASSLFHWTWALDPERTRTDSLNTLADLRKLWKDILSLPRGSALFAHLTFPHYPYVALSDCSIRPPNRYFLWDYRGPFYQPQTNTVASRRERYQQYFEQLQCLCLRLDELFARMRAAGIYDDSIILIHGDHGSRIVMTDPTPENRQALTTQDLVDAFSTLFAMKLPGRAAGYEKSPQPLEQLFGMFVFEAGLKPTNTSPKTAEPYVYLSADDYKWAIQIPYLSPR